MTDIHAGDQISFWASTTLLRGTDWIDTLQPIELKRGDTITLTQALIDANRDKLGRSVFDLADDEDAQVERWGYQLMSRGPWPDSEPTWTPGTVEQAQARESARKAALDHEDPRARKEALQAVEREFGPIVTGQTIGVYAGDGERLQPRLGVI